jgi:hypothetical protein
MEQAERDLVMGLASYSDPSIDTGKVCALFRNQFWGAHLRFFKHLCIGELSQTVGGLLLATSH